jgi:hypothetical protein
MARDVILATAEGYEWATLEPFVETLRSTTFDGDVVLFAAKMDDATRARLEDAGIEVVRARRSRFERLIAGFDSSPRLGSRLRWPPGRSFLGAVGARTLDPTDGAAHAASILAPPEIARYFWYRAHLLEHRARYRNVMLSDARDVVFRGDPFAFVVGDSVHFFLESEDVRIGDSSFNRSWLETAYGDELLEELRDQPISCSGVTIGSSEGVRAYLEVMVSELSRLKRHVHGIDQGVHNVVVHRGLVPGSRLVPNLDGVVLTLGKMSASAATRVLEERRDEVRVIHQYDRHPELAQDVTALARQAPKPGALARLLRREAKILVPPLAGIVAFAITAGLVEVFTDRDWSLSGLEWPEDFVAALVLVCAVTLVYGIAQLFRSGRRRDASTGAQES